MRTDYAACPVTTGAFTDPSGIKDVSPRRVRCYVTRRPDDEVLDLSKRLHEMNDAK